VIESGAVGFGTEFMAVSFVESCASIQVILIIFLGLVITLVVFIFTASITDIHRLETLPAEMCSTSTLYMGATEDFPNSSTAFWTALDFPSL
jgi:hypothetical protein